MTELSEAIRTGRARSGPGGRFVRRGEKGIFILAPIGREQAQENR